MTSSNTIVLFSAALITFTFHDALTANEEANPVLQPHNGELEYSFGTAWELGPDGISSGEDFIGLIRTEALKLSTP